MRILVTGAAGFIGSHVAEKLVSDGHQVMTIDNMSFGRTENLPSAVELVKLDLGTCAEPDIAAVMEKFQPESIVHLAAVHFIPFCMEHPEQTFQSNVRATELIVRLAQATPTRKIVFASTMDVYAPEDRIHSEDDQPKPVNSYGLSKWLGENILAYGTRVNNNIAGVTMRFSNAIGPRETNPHLVPDVLAQVCDPSLPEIRMGYLGAERDFVDVRDVARAVNLALISDTGSYQVFNIGSGASTPVRTVVNLIKEYAGDDRAVVEDAQRFRKFDRATLSPDTKRLREVLGWEPEWSLEDTLEELVQLNTGRRL